MNGTGAGKVRKHDQTIVIDSDCQEVLITIEIGRKCGTGSNGDGGGQGGTGAVATPFLVIPCGAGDQGARPLPLDQAQANQSIQATISNPLAPNGWGDFQIQLSCTVANLGSVPSSAAMIEFYVGVDIGVWYTGHQTLTPAEVAADTQLVGRTTFIAPPGVATTVVCPTLWTPGSFDAAQQGVLAQVSDLFTDRMTAPFDAVNDRHVALNDDVIEPAIWSAIPAKRQFEISEWINDQFEISEPTELAEPPREPDHYPHWASDPNSGVTGEVYLGVGVVYYFAPDTPPKSGWWDMGPLPKNLE
jgi:hypothetical protein